MKGWQVGEKIPPAGPERGWGKPSEPRNSHVLPGVQELQPPESFTPLCKARKIQKNKETPSAPCKRAAGQGKQKFLPIPKAEKNIKSSLAKVDTCFRGSQSLIWSIVLDFESTLNENKNK